jgi:hypothetical protein
MHANIAYKFYIAYAQTPSQRSHIRLFFTVSTRERQCPGRGPPCSFSLFAWTRLGCLDQAVHSEWGLSRSGRTLDVTLVVFASHRNASRLRIYAREDDPESTGSCCSFTNDSSQTKRERSQKSNKSDKNGRHSQPLVSSFHCC